jgi:hypothetical protein
MMPIAPPAIEIAPPAQTNKAPRNGLSTFYVVRYSCDVTDAILIPLPYNEWRHIEIAFMRQADTTFSKRYCAMPTLNVKLSLIG